YAVLMVYSAASVRHLCNIYKSLRKLLFTSGRMAINRVLLLLCAIFVSALPLRAANKISVAAAADLNVALTEIAAQYGKQTGNSIEISFGSSGNFFHQIQ